MRGRWLKEGRKIGNLWYCKMRLFDWFFKYCFLLRFRILYSWMQNTREYRCLKWTNYICNTKLWIWLENKWSQSLYCQTLKKIQSSIIIFKVQNSVIKNFLDKDSNLKVGLKRSDRGPKGRGSIKVKNNINSQALIR